MEIAVIGASCRLPGAPSPSALWQLLRSGKSSIGEVPPGRWQADALDVPPSMAASIRHGGFLEHVDEFDAEFFSMSPREAMTADPQQRLMLELAWEALEDAGIVPGRLARTPTGVFVGSMSDDYAVLTRRAGREGAQVQSLPGLHRSVIANRVSYVLRLRGPSLTVDTGQSSSLVAVHLAAESLRTGETTLAIVGGVNLNLVADSAMAVARFGALSPDGACFTFDARANGYVRGEGGCAVVLKRLADALTDGDRVYAVIRGSAVNNDGGGEALATPCQEAQQEVLLTACARAGVEPSDVQYVELHGTGTRRGDPIEAAALGAVLGRGRAAGELLSVGSVKTNVGHLEGAAGITGLLKAVLAVGHREIPPSLNFSVPNPDIPLAELGLAVQDALSDWPRPGQPLVAGVSSFGMGGTNCHVIVSDIAARDIPAMTAPAAGPRQDPPDPPVPVVLSGRDDGALRCQALRYSAFLEENPRAELADIGFSLATTRTAFRHRAVVVADSRDSLARGCAAVASDGTSGDVIRGKSAEPGGLAFLFAGQGTQRPGMGSQLARAFPVFGAAIEEVSAAFAGHLDWSLRDVLAAADTGATAAPLDRTDYAQPALFAFEVALFRLLESCGVRPDHVAGHSVGELAAAHVAGALSLSDAAGLVAERGRLMQSLPASGAMVAVRAAEEEVTPLLAGVPDLACIAAVNSPRAVVISGDEATVLRIAGELERRGREWRRLRVSHAFHSPLIEPMLGQFRSAIGRVSFAPPTRSLVSAMTGEVVRDAPTPAYWAEHARQPVRFLAAIRTLLASGARTFLEIGPGSALTAMAADSADGWAGVKAVAGLPNGVPERRALLTALGRLHVHGVPVDWEPLFAPHHPRRLTLPTYPFQRQRYWLEPAGEAGPAGEEGRPPERPAPRPASQVRLLPGAERRRAIAHLVREQVAATLLHQAPDAVDSARTFQELGLDSQVAVEFRASLEEAIGTGLPASLIFDYPTPAAVAGYLYELLSAGPGESSEAALGESIDELDPESLIEMAFRAHLEP